MTFNQGMIAGWFKIRNRYNGEQRDTIRRDLRNMIALERARRKNPRSRYHVVP